MKHVDFAIVGAGIAGASIAYELANHASVLLLEAESSAGFHTTGRSAALFAPSYGGREVRALTRASRSFFDRPPPGFSERPLLTARGCLYPARSDQHDRLDAMVDAIRASGGEVEVIGRDAAIGLVPLLRGDYVSRAAMDLEAMDIDVDALHQGFLRGARARAATVLLGMPVAAIERRAGLWHVETGDGTVATPVLINAAGAWADEVASLAGAAPLELQPRRRTALLVDPPVGIDIRNWPAVIDVDELFYFKPDAGKLLLSPADETIVDPGDAQPDELDIAIGVDRVQAALDLTVTRVNHSWAGLRTFSPDRVPVIGFDPVLPGFFWCAGQGGYGIQTAPGWGRLAAALAAGREAPDDILAEGLSTGAVAPARFAEAKAEG